MLRLRFGTRLPELLQRLQSLAGVREVRASDSTGVDVYADRGGSLIPEIASLAVTPAPNCATCTSPSPAWRSCSCTTPEGACAIELENFFRDAGARRPRGAPQCDPTLLQNLLQPLLFVFIFGRVMIGSGKMPAAYKSLLLPGIMAISMVITGV